LETNAAMDGNKKAGRIKNDPVARSMKADRHLFNRLKAIAKASFAKGTFPEAEKSSRRSAQG
jgi:hypothetical protein